LIAVYRCGIIQCKKNRTTNLKLEGAYVRRMDTNFTGMINKIFVELIGEKEEDEKYE